jgi:hypothetical protein
MGLSRWRELRNVWLTAEDQKTTRTVVSKKEGWTDQPGSRNQTNKTTQRRGGIGVRRENSASWVGTRQLDRGSCLFDQGARVMGL